MDFSEKEKITEAILFASGDAVEIRDIAQVLEIEKNEAVKILENLKKKYDDDNRGITIIEVGDKYQMCTNTEYFNYLNKLFTKPKKKILSTTLLETLAIIAYKQPITKAEIEAIRGVNADHAVNKLVEYSLVRERGRLDTPGKPILFGTTEDFLRYFGYANLESLPNVPETDEITLEGFEDI